MEEKYLKKKRKNNKIKIICLSVVLILLIAISIYLVFSYYQKENKVEYENTEYELYQYFTGIKESYTGKVTLVRNGGITKIETEGTQIDSNSIPMYFQNDATRVILPENMSIIFTSERSNKYKTIYFTELLTEETTLSNQTYIKRDGNEILLPSSVLYDGEDLYFFPYGATITIDGTDYELSPLSYVIACYRDQIEIYDRASDKYTILENISDDAMATFNKTKFNLSTDMVIFDNDKSMLLLHSIEQLKSYN